MSSSIRISFLPVVAAFFLVMLCAPAVHAQEADSEAENALEVGAWTLQFQVTSDFTLGSFQGATISAKKQLSSGSAFRFGTTLNGSYATTSVEEAGEEEPLSESDNEQFISVNAQWLGYTPVRSEVGLYYGAGPELSLARQEDTREDEDGEFKNTSTTTQIGVGVLGALGVEWFVRPNVSLTAEYRTSLSYLRLVNSQEAERPAPAEDRERTLTQNEVRLDARGVLFGVSVYF